jgi:hypothetical protein
VKLPGVELKVDFVKSSRLKNSRARDIEKSIPKNWLIWLRIEISFLHPTLFKDSMFESICTLPLSSELFTQDLHPTEPVLAVGLSAGHVQCFRLPPISQNTNGLVDSSSSSSSSPPVNGCGQIETQWRTRRHKGSCRTLGFSMDGDTLYSAGTDGLLKAASTDSGRVSCKILVPRDA